MVRKPKDTTKSIIQNKARQLFLKKGYSETTIRDISTAADVTPGAIYLYFKGKRDLFDSLDISEMEQVRPEFEKKKKKILSAALANFGKKGFEATTMDQIALACGVSKAALYTYCESKEDLLVMVLQESAFNIFSRQIRTQFDDSDWETVLLNMGRSHMHIGKEKERVALFRTVIQESVRFPEIGKLFYERAYKAACDEVVDYLLHLQGKGKIDLKDIDISMAVQTYFASLQSYYLLNSIIAGIPLTNDPEEYLQMSTRIFLNGLKNISK